MKKALSMITILFSLSAGQCDALTCNSHYQNLDFWMVTINTQNELFCGYRYCYYNCIEHFEQMPGHYQPSSGPWEKEENSIECSGNVSNCEFTPR